MKRITIISLSIVTTMLLSSFSANVGSDHARSIKVALILDTSNSMDGLIEQAKSQLWSVVGELSKATCDDKRPSLEIALYEYGNDNLNSREGYIRQVTELTNDLDEISRQLFELTTNGGSEYCGHVIETSLNQLDWESSNDDLKLIFIAGNEPFTQGSVDFRDACYYAKSKGVVINTIFCGGFQEGINTSWKKGADIALGSYMAIEQNRVTTYIDSPYDDKIAILNVKLNATYVYYGSQGMINMKKQKEQDDNALGYSKANSVDRAISKSSHIYSNSHWDLVDACELTSMDIKQVDKTTLPKEYQHLSDAELQKVIDEKSQERSALQKEIQTLSKKRTEHVNNVRMQRGEEDNLNTAMLKSIKEQAKRKNISFN